MYIEYSQIEPDILEYEVNWALAVQKMLVEVTEFQLNYFKS